MSMSTTETILATQFGTQWEEAFDAVRGLDRYGRNWDGEDANAVKMDAIKAALEWLDGLRIGGFPPPGAIYPTVGGTVMLEWHLPDGSGWAAEAVSANQIEVVVREPEQEPEFVVIRLTPTTHAWNSNEPSLYTEGDHFSIAA